MRRVHTDESGFSLVEVLIVVVIAAVVMGVLGDSIINSMRFQRESSAHLHTLGLTKTAFERLARDIRGADPLVAAEPDRVRMRVASPGGGGPQVVEWRVEGGRLVRETNSPASLIAVDLDGPLFAYFDAQGASLPLEDEGPDIPNVEVHTVEVLLRVPYGNLGRTIELREAVKLRNSEG